MVLQTRLKRWMPADRVLALSCFVAHGRKAWDLTLTLVQLPSPRPLTEQVTQLPDSQFLPL